ncbi:Xpo1-domain-containing protein [Hesseltinella vesiculosa]|uniref:Exportin-T n=1 Tax=Hesseltinella vesiculosa TaxID=101127 RepID=A0A1X2GF12_9FUNG|nr:Xpo1-domain-containing protein [Hesseltinella vesiculosa]
MDQIEQAVVYALDPSVDPNLKAQANTYCEQVKQSPDGWQICLQLFMKEPKAVAQARFFALQVLENTLQNRYDTLDASAVEYIERTMMEYLRREFVENTETDSEENYIRNKAAQSLTLLFAHVYPSGWPTFFKDLMALARTSTGSSHAKAADFFLRLCISIDEEIGRMDIPRHRDELTRNTSIKDAMRMGDIQLLAAYWFELLQEFRGQSPSIAQLALKNIGCYVAWMDISLVVNDQVMNALYELLSDANLRIPSCECLAEVVSKGMLPLDKLNMIQMLNITDTLGRLDLSDPEFVESVARLTNALGIELCKIYNDSSLPDDAKNSTWLLIEQLSPFLLKFLANEYDDTTTAVFAFVNDLMVIFKKQKKTMRPFSPSQLELLGSLLGVFIAKMKYDEDTEWGSEEDEPDEEALFAELRKNLRIFMEHIAAIDTNLYIQYIHTSVMDIINKFKAGSELDWRDVELCLYVFYTYGEALPKAALQYSVDKDPNHLSPLGEMVREMVTSNISTFAHPSVPLQYFENLVRYYQFFELRPDFLPQALEAFVDTRGIHHSLKPIRSRCWYLFYRFVKTLKPILGPFVQTVLSSMGDLLTVEAELPVMASSADGMPLPVASTFDSQLYLFEAVGMLISSEHLDVAKQTEYLQIALQPMVDGIQTTMAQGYTNDDELFMIKLHHNIMAIGSVAKGFPTLGKGASCNQPWASVFIQATEIILNVLQTYNQFELIRDAARFSFARLITCLGADILAYLPPLINGLLTECQITELVDFLPFIGLIAHKYKPMIQNVMDELLLPLVKRVFDFLNATASGTDEAILLMDLRRAYLTFLMSIFHADLEQVLASDRNIGHLVTILQTVLHFSKDNSDPSTQKMSFGVFLKFVSCFAGSVQQGTRVPGFDQFVYNELLPITFSIPMSNSFNVADGQSMLVFGEITGIQKTLYDKQGNEYLEYMMNVFFPSIQCPRETAERYCQAIQQCDLKQFKKYYQSFITEAKS